jgi:hypothetical protein
MPKPTEITIINDEPDRKIYNEDEFIFCKNSNGDITSCGFSVNSALLREGKSPMMGITSAKDTSIVTDDLFQNMSIPTGIFYIQQKIPSFKQEQIYEEEDVDDDLFDKLLNLASDTEKRRRGTRKARGVILVAGAKNKSKKKQINASSGKKK